MMLEEDYNAVRKVLVDTLKQLEEALAQIEERNFCSRCGKRNKDLTLIHTCTPPQD